MGKESQKICRLEIVWVKNEHIDLFASMVSLENGKAVVNGRIILGDEKKLLISSDTNFKGALRSEFLSACRAIADYYGADLCRQKISLFSRTDNASLHQKPPFYALN
jgi:hypothetical protein